MIEALLRWYAQRGAREQRLLRWGVCVAPALVLIGALMLLHRSVIGFERRVAAKQNDLAWMQAVAPLLATSGSVPVEGPRQSAAQSIERAIAEAGLSRFAVGTTATDKGGISVRFEKAPFNGLLAWAQGLALRHGLRIDAARIEAVDIPGSVNASFTVQELP